MVQEGQQHIQGIPQTGGLLMQVAVRKKRGVPAYLQARMMVGEGTQTAVHTAGQGALPTLERKPWPVAGSKFLANGSCPTPHLVGASERCGSAAAWFGCGSAAVWFGCGPAAASGSCSSGAAWDCCCPAASATPSGSEDLSEGLWAAELPLPLRWWWSVFAWWTSCS